MQSGSIRKPSAWLEAVDRDAGNPGVRHFASATVRLGDFTGLRAFALGSNKPEGCSILPMAVVGLFVGISGVAQLLDATGLKD